MDGAADRGINASPLALLGIGEAEEHVYRALLKRHKASATVIADDLAVTLDHATGFLDHLESLGLGTHISESPKIYVAVEPELAIDGLIRQRQWTSEQARAAVPSLVKAFAQASLDDPGRQPSIELITHRASLHQAIVQLFRSAKRELLVFQKAPAVLPGAKFKDEGVPIPVIRTISDQSFLDMPEALKWLGRDLAAGEESRACSRLPMKMVIADRRTAIINLDARDPEASTLLVHRSTLLEVLCMLFDSEWEHATPILCPPDGEVKIGTASNVHGIEWASSMISLLSAGLNDKAIAQELDISSSTLSRRISDLMSIYGVHTRFQLGLQIARSNHVDSH